MTEYKYKVVITNGMSDLRAQLEILDANGCQLIVTDCESPEDVIAAAADADGILAGDVPITADVIESLEKCKIIVRLGVGYDTVDIEAAAEKSIPVCNVPEETTDEVADHSLALALALARRLPMADRLLREGQWQARADTSVSGILSFPKMTFVVLGYGNIGKAAVDRARAFGFKLAAYAPHNDPQEFDKSDVQRLSLDEALAQADILSIHLPLNSDTHHLLNAERLLQMKPNAILINTGRGEIIETKALVEALEHGHLACAGLDVFEEEPLPADHPLCSMDNVLLTPHLGAYSKNNGGKVGRRAAEELWRGLCGEPLQSQVNETK